MSLTMLADVDWVAVVVAALVWFALGAAWYMTPFVAERWQRAGGIEVDPDARPNPAVFVLTLAAYLVGCAATGLLAVAIGITGVGEGAVLGLVVGVGYALTAAGVAAVYDQKPEPVTWFWINGVFNVAALVAVGAVIGAFA